ncbi:RanGTP-binding protein-domain-containing protein [Fusarium solani]|uniref:RanGTP-binding protein-domain-containing protein n=1 Tax=Fusarium solani TaxID=169388 RepID=A0A9P9RAP5_FUSSL|nr:RanGTP-binding protein-domain-containing protein [Fusarium solani]KAH7271180.1 RanGTP-binding protein-domain-containing protein [Fusarium solani]
MDDFLAAVGVQAMKYAIRSGITLTSTYALGQCSRLLKSVEGRAVYSELKSLQSTLDSRIKIISPAIDLIEFKSGRGNLFLESATPLAKSLHKEIVSLGRRIEAATTLSSDSDSDRAQSKSPPISQDDLLAIVTSIKALLERIDRDIPLLQLAITASGESLSTSLPTGISPSRLLQASTLLIVGDTQFAQDPTRPVQIGPTFTLSLYMLFLGHASTLTPRGATGTPTSGAALASSGSAQPLSDDRAYGLGEGDRKPLWQEVLHKARVRICRTRRDFFFDSRTGYHAGCLASLPTPVPSENSWEYAYHLEIIEDLDDGRLHDDEQNTRSYDDIPMAGIRESIPVHELSKIFYTDTGRILNIGSTTDSEQRPVLLLKRDTRATPSKPDTEGIAGFIEDSGYGAKSTMIGGGEAEDEQADIDRQLLQESRDSSTNFKKAAPIGDHSKWKFPAHLDPEWIALEVFEEDDEEAAEDDDDASLDSGTMDKQETPPRQGTPRDRRSLDSRVVDQIKRLSLSGPEQSSSLQPVTAAETENFVARSPFGAITTSLSLMEMLIRLASLQEFQQASHLSIPDHILTFFLEETSTTGLVGETQWRARSEAKRRMGFDPYTDTPTK